MESDFVKLAEGVEINVVQNTFRIDGVNVSRDMFFWFAKFAAEHNVFEIVRRCEDGAVTFRQFAPGSVVLEKRTKTVVLSGSSRFVDVMAVCAWLLERDEGAIAMGLHLLPGWYPNCPEHHLAEHEGVASAMDELHLRKIDLANEVFVVNVDHYIGESTQREIEYAKSIDKPIRWFTDDPIGERVRAMSRFAPDDPSRCAVCGWPLVESPDQGCVRGNCSMRPLPEHWYSPERARLEGYGVRS